MRNAGFDLAVYSEYSDSVRKEARKGAIKETMRGIEESFEAEAGFELTDIDRGVYVISLSTPLAILYRYGWSPVIYIGIGNIVSRIESHFNNSLFDLMESVSGANFDFSFASPKKLFYRGDDYYKHVEFLMLEYFCEKVGGVDETRRYPILNRNAGADKDIDDNDEWWNTPLKATGRKPLWALKPTHHSHFAPLDN